MKSLVEVIASRCEVDVSVLQDAIDNPFMHLGTDCILWPGAMGGSSQTTPMIRFKGRLIYIRSTLAGGYSRPLCGDNRCINPHHLQ